jgi:hypothetical protein
MGLHKADLIFHSRHPTSVRAQPVLPFPLPETAVSIDLSLFRAHHYSYGSSVAAVPFTAAGRKEFVASYFSIRPC